VLRPWYDQIRIEAQGSATLHADETGWRVDGRTHWLWCFCNPTTCFYMIDQSRGAEALLGFFLEAYRGVLVTDFWAPYRAALLDEEEGEQQCCIPHLLRDIADVTDRKMKGKTPDRASAWLAFSKMLRRLLRDARRLRDRPDYTPQRYARRIQLINRRLSGLVDDASLDPDAQRLIKRLRRFRDELFTFLRRPEAPWDNNFAERQIRPAVILRKNTQCNRSERGADTQAILMSVYRTLKLRGRDPRSEILTALRAWSETGSLPPLPSLVVADG
jgi:transposase